MRYIDLIAERPLIWGLFIVYMLGTSYLAWLGHKRTTDIRSFALGSGNMNPWVVGITLAASIASTATFVINPGFVYVHGLSAFMHLGLAAGLGIAAGLIVMSAGFRAIGEKHKAITLPQWTGKRYDSRALSIFFAAVNLLSLSFVVLIVGGLSIVMQQTLGLSNIESLLLIVGFVFSYVFVGGTYAHAYTNTLQGIIMLVVSVVIIASGAHYLSGGIGPFMDKIAAQDPNLVMGVNPKSPLFSSPFTVYVAGFIIGFALVCQPHIMTKALYVKGKREIRQYLAVTLVSFGIFTALLLVGLYARVMELPKDALLDPTTGAFRQDQVMAAYLANSFGPGMLSVITVALLAAGMSTLDGILVALSSIAANDLFLNLTEKNLLKNHEEEQRARIAHRASQAILLGIGVAALLISIHPPKLLGIFGQVGVYGIVAASTVPILFGILFKRMDKRAAFAAAATGLAVHFSLYSWASWAKAHGVQLADGVLGSSALRWLFDHGAVQLGLLNPGVTATYGLILSSVVGLLGLALAPKSVPDGNEAPSTDETKPEAARFSSSDARSSAGA
ncbi:MAG: sodium:solute symporter family protein [Polyangiaceae bacterium]